jgi:hypothetical protein
MYLIYFLKEDIIAYVLKSKIKNEELFGQAVSRMAARVPATAVFANLYEELKASHVKNAISL